ncbi:indole-3-glycerol phosphate synthase TrpC [Desulfofustis limnaeus]|jgi:indole-3-glycerol phosphate synthase|uniref:Indole-3-glycerol phosphate synthase n=1 Tax=Desulfofustis limnaeus TaxID=2740163 RepID=A0ABM7W929_9BACT|nr:indole-3-glycerol phosphate synthase TrpC [Desulfofustis limnaeus]MDX9896628.1 indole-3-glycerol phosphate synthase TrpC [Desulfofustis sp.]BDD87413.1 indole-3-glycerol phosphate synthase [Desulfofustis limnaeus]
MILDRIVARKKEEVAALRTTGIVLPHPYKEREPAPPRGFRQALLADPGVAVIAEIKKASPSKGVICADFDPVRIAVNYRDQGASALSVLTDVDFFQGSLLYLLQVREAVHLPVLRKDFIIDRMQIEEARAHGADAVLLIAAILDVEQLRDYRLYAAELGMDSLVEVHDEPEVEAAVAAGAELIGVNNRNLRDFSVDIGTTLRLKKIIPDAIPVVSESGLQSPADMELLKRQGVCAALIGESLMRAGAGSDLLHRLRGVSPAAPA